MPKSQANRQQAFDYLRYMLSQIAPGGVAPKTAGDAFWDGTQDAGPTMFQADPVQRALYRILQQGSGGHNNATMVDDFLKK